MLASSLTLKVWKFLFPSFSILGFDSGIFHFREERQTDRQTGE